MTLKDLSVKRFQALYAITQEEHETETDRDVALLVCLTGKPDEYFLNLSLDKFKDYRRVLEAFSLDKIQPKPAKYISANGKVYAPVYDFRKVTAAQFIDVTHFCKDPEAIIENLPQILASFCRPTKKTIFGRRVLPYDAEYHKEVSADMEQATIFDAYSIALFFWAVWNGSLQITGDYLVREILKKKTATKTKITTNEQAAILNILERYGDGITASKIFQRSKA